jgi:hypothetical protein
MELNVQKLAIGFNNLNVDSKELLEVSFLFRLFKFIARFQILRFHSQAKWIQKR